MDIRIIIRIHDLIQSNRTGNPKELSSKLGISERSVYNYVSFMRKDLKAPIAFNYNKRSYEYVEECMLRFVS